MWILTIFTRKVYLQLKNHRARLVSNGFSQVEGIDFHEVFSPVVKHRSIRNILALVARKNMELEQLDITTAFLLGDQRICMQQPQMFEVKSETPLVATIWKIHASIVVCG